MDLCCENAADTGEHQKDSKDNITVVYDKICDLSHIPELYPLSPLLVKNKTLRLCLKLDKSLTICSKSDIIES